MRNKSQSSADTNSQVLALLQEALAGMRDERDAAYLERRISEIRKLLSSGNGVNGNG